MGKKINKNLGNEEKRKYWEMTTKTAKGRTNGNLLNFWIVTVWNVDNLPRILSELIGQVLVIETMEVTKPKTKKQTNKMS